MTGKVVAALMGMLVLGGCWSRVEVNDRAIISAAALDRLEDGRLRMAIQIVLPGAVGRAGGQGQGGQNQPVMTVYAAGAGPLEISRRLQLMVPRRLFWAHMHVLMIGEDLAREGVREVLDFFSRQREVRLGTDLVVTKGEALATMQGLPDLEQVPAEAIRETMRAHVGIQAHLKGFLRALGTSGMDPYAPYVERIAAEREDDGALFTKGPEFHLTGTAVFRDDKMVGFLDEVETRGLLWLRGEIKTGVVTVDVPGMEGTASAQLIRASVRKQVRMEKGKPVLYVTAIAEDDLYEVQAPLDVSDPRVVTRLERLFRDRVVERIEVVASRLQQLGSDAFEFGKQVERDHPRAWTNMEKRWQEEIFPHARIVVESVVQIRRTGMSGKTRGTPDEKLRKWKGE